MKKTNHMLLLCCLFWGVLLTAKPADAMVNEDAFNKHKDVYNNGKDCRTLYDKAGNVYLQYNNSQYVYIVSTPDAKKGHTTLLIPDTVQIDGKTYYIGGVGADPDETEETVFYMGEGYKKIVFGKNVTFIERYTFGGCDTLEEISFLGNDINIQEFSFSNCKNLERITGSEKITFIDEDAFRNAAITHFSISDKCKEIGECAFSGCKNLRELPDISKVKGHLGESIFSGCYGLKKIILSEGLKEITSHMFSYCKNVREVYIPKSVKTIGEEAFWGCTKLKGNVTVDPKNKYLSAKDNMILNKKGDTLLSMISPVKVMVIPSYVKIVKSDWMQDYENKRNHKMLETIIIQNKNIKFFKDSVPCWYRPGYSKQKINVLYPDTRGPFSFTQKQMAKSFYKKASLSKCYTQRPYTLHPAPTRVKAKLKKGRVQITFKKLKNATVKKHKITYRIKKNGKYKAQKEKVIKGTRATLCSLQKGEICEVRVSAYTKQGGVWLPGKFSRMVKVRGKA